MGEVDDARTAMDGDDPAAQQRDGAALGEAEHERADDHSHAHGSQWRRGSVETAEASVMGWREVRGSLGPAQNGRLPVVPTRWRLPALLATIAVCITLFVVAVLIGIHG